jgi:hypothetical protein
MVSLGGHWLRHGRWVAFGEGYGRRPCGLALKRLIAACGITVR